MSSTKFRRALSVTIAGYWLLMFLATHLTRVPAAVEAEGSDKWFHFGGYAVLALLLAVRRAVGVPVTWRAALGLMGVVALYGMIDEITQIPVGRDADIADWYADVAGAAIGLAVFGILTAVKGRFAARGRGSHDQRMQRR